MKNLLQAVGVLLAIAPASAQPIPYFTATSVQRGTVVTRSHSARIVANFDTSTSFKATEGIIGVKVELRSFGKLDSPFEIQCFFVAKDSTKARYVYDFVKAFSEQPFDQLTMYGRDLFAGSETVNKASTTIPATGFAGGQSVYGSATLSLKQTTVRPGSTVEGWIVRVISEGRIVRSDASLYELKTFAERQAAELDKIADQAEAHK